MAFSYNPATDAGKVRLLVSDTTEFEDDGVTRLYVFEDSEVAAALDQWSEDVYRAAGMLLRSLAANKARIAKRVKALDVEVDLKAASKELIDLAASMEKASDDGGAFAIAEMVPTGLFAERERRIKARQESGV